MQWKIKTIGAIKSRNYGIYEIISIYFFSFLSFCYVRMYSFSLAHIVDTVSLINDMENISWNNIEWLHGFDLYFSRYVTCLEPKYCWKIYMTVKLKYFPTVDMW